MPSVSASDVSLITGSNAAVLNAYNCGLIVVGLLLCETAVCLYTVLILSVHRPERPVAAQCMQIKHM